MKPSDDDINDLLVCEELREVAEHIEQMTDEERADCLHDLNEVEKKHGVLWNGIIVRHLLTSQDKRHSFIEAVKSGKIYA